MGLENAIIKIYEERDEARRERDELRQALALAQEQLANLGPKFEDIMRACEHNNAVIEQHQQRLTAVMRAVSGVDDTPATTDCGAVRGVRKLRQEYDALLTRVRDMVEKQPAPTTEHCQTCGTIIASPCCAPNIRAWLKTLSKCAGEVHAIDYLSVVERRIKNLESAIVDMGQATLACENIVQNAVGYASGDDVEIAGASVTRCKNAVLRTTNNQTARDVLADVTTGAYMGLLDNHPRTPTA